MEHKVQILEKEIVNEKIDELRPEELREFGSRMVDIASDKMAVDISGKNGSIEGYTLHVENKNNPIPLNIKITEGDVFRSKSGVLVIPKGIIEISGEKKFDDLNRFQQSKGELQPLPIRDPDLVQIDQRTFRQTGTIYVKVINAKVLISR